MTLNRRKLCRSRLNRVASQIVDRGLDLLGRERLFAPARPEEVGVFAVGLPAAYVVDASVERRRVHLRGVLAHEGRVRLVPAELDQLLARGRLLCLSRGRRGSDGPRQGRTSGDCMLSHYA